MRRPLRAALTCVALIALTIVAAEALLQLGSLFMRGREHDPKAGASVVLCVGDSHTYGAPLTEPESYPAQLQTMLDAESPGRWSVVNAGIPGTNTAQLRARLPGLVERYRPAVVVFWVGVNNLWNGAAQDTPETWGDWFHGIAMHSRLYKLSQVWQHDQAINAAQLRGGGRIDSTVAHPNEGAEWKITHPDGTVEVQNNERVAWRKGEKATERAERDFAAMVDYLRTENIAVAMVSYPRHTIFFEPANRAIRAVAAERGVRLVDGTAAAERVPEAQRIYLEADHPSAPIYREIARDVASVIE